MLKNNLFSEKELDNINKKIIEEIKVAAEFALESNYPKNEELYTNVYV